MPLCMCSNLKLWHWLFYKYFITLMYVHRSMDIIFRFRYGSVKFIFRINNFIRLRNRPRYKRLVLYDCTKTTKKKRIINK